MHQPTRLQQDLADRIVQLVNEDGLSVGDLLNENSLARRLEVSRTPVRGALQHLENQGIVVRRPNRGVELIALPKLAKAPFPAAADEDEEWLVRIARDQRNGAFEQDISEVEIMRRYGLNRPTVQRVLSRLGDLEMVERKPGYGWRFLTGTRDVATHDESYRFRMMIEPMGILEPSFRLEPSWVELMRRLHNETLERPWHESSSVAFFEMNAAFHEGLAAASGNRFVHAAIRNQNQLRRFSQYDWKFGFERVVVNCREHLEMLDFLARDEREIASLLMRRHLQRASQVRSRKSPDPG
ncbi:GntR family transcriptional regulator [Microvirga lotononidis]|uniref:Transcriptional regulator n=1 Tax=Microvirga lotononidis TaxID=864069 RepID=I4YQU1_9HYPH|nr:GntR family transcriptional regulator [Microvirga lotononidis]EIM26333.1 transcriptional regulator [Microvirga lotononidis]WQO30703.1 GntR family transcriptional regulator [Microvirga lotononidis]